MHFRGLRPLCSSRLRPQEKSLVDQLPLDQNLLKTVLSWTTFLNWRPLFHSLSNFTFRLLWGSRLRLSVSGKWRCLLGYRTKGPSKNVLHDFFWIDDPYFLLFQLHKNTSLTLNLNIEHPQSLKSIILVSFIPKVVKNWRIDAFVIKQILDFATDVSRT